KIDIGQPRSKDDVAAGVPVRSGGGMPKRPRVEPLEHRVSIGIGTGAPARIANLAGPVPKASQRILPPGLNGKRSCRLPDERPAGLPPAQHIPDWHRLTRQRRELP